MKISAQINSLYNELQPIAKSLQDHIDEKLRQKCAEKEWLYIRRIKGLESFAQKLEMGRYKSIELVDDVFACTIVVQNVSEISNAEALVNQFLAVSERRPADPQRHHLVPENFSYDSLRLYCKVKPPHIGKEYENLTFEVQIKTFLEHAWSIATHDFQYKSSKISWAKARLVSQLKAMLDNIELSILESTHLATSGYLDKGNDEYDKLNATIKFYEKNWGTDKLPKDLRRLAQNTLQLMTAIKIDLSDITDMLAKENDVGRGINTISLSPFQIIVQGLINQRTESIAQFLSHEDSRYRLILTSGMTVPEELAIKDSKKVFYITGNEVSATLLRTKPQANNSNQNLTSASDLSTT
jgi:ppGpp synthetase/RelA/SpoT-type nucleotidyltranferase